MFYSERQIPISLLTSATILKVHFGLISVAPDGLIFINTLEWVFQWLDISVNEENYYIELLLLR